MRLHGWKNIRTEEEKIALPGDALQPYAFSGIQILSPQAMRHIPFSGKFSLVDVYLYQAARHVIRGFDHTGDLFVDVGKPESISVAEHLFP